MTPANARRDKPPHPGPAHRHTARGLPFHTLMEPDMQNLSRQELLDLLDDMRRQVAEGLAPDGDLRFRQCPDGIDRYSVAACYRTGRHIRLVGVEQLDGAA